MSDTTSAPALPATFLAAFSAVVGVEGGYDTTRSDRGNWTSGTVGKGFLKGTKFGISAAAYPTLNIAQLTLADAQAIYFRDYWTAASCDKLPAGVAYLAFDAAVNQGVGFVSHTIQEAAGVDADGVIGPVTLAAVQKADPVALLTEFAARRMESYGTDSEFPQDGLGWSRRLMTMFASALKIQQEVLANAPVAAQ